MSDPIDLPLDADDRLADPPLLDLFREDADEGVYVATFVPSDDLSPEPTLSVRVDKESVEGRRIGASLDGISEICGSRLTLASHLGGGNYTIRLTDGRTASLDTFDNSLELFDRLKQIAQDAEMCYRISILHARGQRPAI
jgi:hypothetical protein